MSCGARLVVVAMVAAFPPAAVAAPGPPLQGSVVQTVSVDEDRIWITEILEIRSASGDAAVLPPSARRVAVPPEAGEGTRGGLGVGPGRLEEVAIVGGAVELPAEVPPEGISVGLEYSIPAAGESVEFVRRYPVPIVEARVSVTARVPGVRVAIAGAPAGEGVRSPGGGSWTAVAERTAPLAAGAPVRVAVTRLPSYRTPFYAKAALALACAVALAGLALSLRRRRQASSTRPAPGWCRRSEPPKPT